MLAIWRCWQKGDNTTSACCCLHSDELLCNIVLLFAGLWLQLNAHAVLSAFMSVQHVCPDVMLGLTARIDSTVRHSTAHLLTSGVCASIASAETICAAAFTVTITGLLWTMCTYTYGSSTTEAFNSEHTS